MLKRCRAVLVASLVLHASLSAGSVWSYRGAAFQ
jgi:hypothetical protein